MDNTIFEKVSKQDIGNGQFFTMIAKTQSGFSALAKKSGYWKVSKFQSHVFVKSFSELTNTSTGMTELNATYKPENDSLYNNIAHNGLLATLKSNPEKLYIRCMFNEKTAKPEVKFVDDNGNVITAEECLTTSALEKFRHEKEFSQMSKSEKIAEISQVNIRYFSWENVMYLSIGGKVYEQ
jgi:hypothetical protein